MFYKAILNSIYYTGAHAIFRPSMGGIGAALMLHHVRDQDFTPFSPNYHLSISAQFLDELLSELKASYDFISMDELASRIDNPEAYRDHKPFLTVTLDDGYRDNITNAAPVFRKHKVPYIVYVVPGYAEHKTPLWWEDLEFAIAQAGHFEVEMYGKTEAFDVTTPNRKHAAYDRLLPYLLCEADEDYQRSFVADLCDKVGFDDKAHVREQMATWDELLELNQDPLCTLGAHSMGHHFFSKLTYEQLRYEMTESRKILERKTGAPVDHFAFPYGIGKSAQGREFKLAEELGFKTAVTTRHGVLYADHRKHITALPRVSLNGHYQSTHYVKALLSGLPTLMNNFGSRLNVA